MNIYLLSIRNMIAVNFYYNFTQISWFSITLFMDYNEIKRGQTLVNSLTYMSAKKLFLSTIF